MREHCFILWPGTVVIDCVAYNVHADATGTTTLTIQGRPNLISPHTYRTMCYEFGCNCYQVRVKMGTEARALSVYDGSRKFADSAQRKAQDIEQNNYIGGLAANWILAVFDLFFTTACILITLR